MTPIAAAAAASRSLTRPARCRARAPVLHEEEVRMTIDQHIEELRAELKACPERAEQAQIAAELQAALERREQLQGAAIGAPGG
ncbi:hypothetical protein LK12_22155 [Novosphingobium malaysiense]|uniref:Uncharacterized protein n=2 Tax=Novosphingobium malaysiense TaxID=1348853 RepID=A0A0B1ZIP0_9SPHN|nr:hypothetical protein LK12_22155 [Novosphingobium malaysiense]